MKRSLTALLGGVAMLSLAACGDTVGQRAASGGLIGAGAGAATGAAVGDAGTGMLTGAAIGAAAGALTDEDDLYLGEWRL